MSDRRRPQAIALAINLILFASNLWPLALPVARAEPLVLGLPLALAWVLGTVVASFLTLLWLHRAEHRA